METPFDRNPHWTYWYLDFILPSRLVRVIIKVSTEGHIWLALTFFLSCSNSLPWFYFVLEVLLIHFVALTKGVGGNLAAIPSPPETAVTLCSNDCWGEDTFLPSWLNSRHQYMFASSSAPVPGWKTSGKTNGLCVETRDIPGQNKKHYIRCPHPSLMHQY